MSNHARLLAKQTIPDVTTTNPDTPAAINVAAVADLTINAAVTEAEMTAVVTKVIVLVAARILKIVNLVEIIRTVANLEIIVKTANLEIIRTIVTIIAIIVVHEKIENTAITEITAKKTLKILIKLPLRQENRSRIQHAISK